MVVFRNKSIPLIMLKKGENRMGNEKKLNLKDLKNIAGGTPGEGFAYLDTLCDKYNLAPGDYETLDGMMTPEELDTFSDLFLNGIWNG